MLSRRSTSSICQLLALQERGFLELLFEKYGIQGDLRLVRSMEEALLSCVRDATERQLMNLLDEIIRTRGDLRTRIAPRYRFDERWEDLCRCLELDGYRVDGNRLVLIDPTISGDSPMDDDLSSELRRSGLRQGGEIIQLMENSAEAFRRTPPDYNGSLANARIALETLARSIARERLSKFPASFDETKWGQVLAYLRTSGMLSRAQEEGVAGAYSFVSPGAHTAIGLTEREMVRLGRSLVAYACYFLVKVYRGSVE
jgi:hypothetical protein